MSNNILEFAMGLLRSNPNMANNPQAKAYMDVISSGDSAKIENLARNICASYGVQPEQAAQQARSFFHI